MDKIEFTPNYKYLNISYIIGADHSINFTIDPKFAIINLRCYAVIAIPKDKNDKKFEKIVAKTTFDACKLFRGSKGHLFGNIIYNVLQRYSDRVLKCPTDVAEYHFTNIVIDDNYIPKFLLSDDFRLVMDGKIVGKALPENKTVELVTGKVYLRIAKN